MTYVYSGSTSTLFLWNEINIVLTSVMFLRVYYEQKFKDEDKCSPTPTKLAPFFYVVRVWTFDARDVSCSSHSRTTNSLSFSLSFGRSYVQESVVHVAFQVHNSWKVHNFRELGEGEGGKRQGANLAPLIQGRRSFIRGSDVLVPA